VDSVWLYLVYFCFSSRRRHTRSKRDWSSDVCSSDLIALSFFLYDNKTTIGLQILLNNCPISPTINHEVLHVNNINIYLFLFLYGGKIVSPNLLFPSLQ